MQSSLVRGKWIERLLNLSILRRGKSSLVRGKWIERSTAMWLIWRAKSSLVRGKWIERDMLRAVYLAAFVFPREREVD